MTRVILAALLLAGCGNGAKLQPGDFADALTTVEVIRNPAYVEMNPLLPNDPVAGPLVLLAQKYFGKALLIEMGLEADTANNAVNSFGWYWACQNLALFAGVEPVGRAVAGVACALVSWEK